VTDSDPADRIRKLLLRGDNLLKNGRDPDKARAAFEEALRIATEEEGSVDPRVAELAQRRLESMGG
jgi:hypothetical protein